MFANPPRTSGVERCFGYTVRITDGPNFYMQYKDEFIHRIYHFEATRPDPLIIDGGSNIGMSILYFKHVYPQARIIGFEPDPAIVRILQENVTRNGLTDVTLINAGLSAQAGTATFTPDGSAGGRIGGGSSIEVRMERLSDYLNEPVDLLKLNIEGEELPVLQEAAAGGKLGNVRELVLEYHGWPDGEQRLGDILNLLDRHGYRYLVHDFDAETCGASKPPFRLTPQTTWFCLVYARRLDDDIGPASSVGSGGGGA
jgi:FkbM family methyltransferase